MSQSNAEHGRAPLHTAAPGVGTDQTATPRPPSEPAWPDASEGVPGLVWEVEPTKTALDEARRRRERRSMLTPDDGSPHTVPDLASSDVCTEVGRRLLRSHFTFSGWVLRRVEKVQFVSDRRIRRTSTIEFRVPPEAPIIQSEVDRRCWLIPLSMMRRRTLVDLDLRTEDDVGISVLGLRFTQKLDEAMLRAAARLACPSAEDHREVDAFIEDAISGPRDEVEGRYRTYEAWREGSRSGTPPPGTDELLGPYFRNATFRATLERLWRNFTLYVTVPVDDERGRHRTFRMAFEERVEWRYQLPNLTMESEESDGTQVWTYRPLAHARSARRQLGHFFGWRPTRIRFLVPSAENCASYHFEFNAPTGLWITRAAFVGGRPNLHDPHVTPWDSIESAEHSVGLHAVEVPNGSLCRAQVHLRVPTRGWLSTIWVSCLAAFLTLLGVAVHARHYGETGHWSTEQVTNMVLLLITVTAGGATYVAQHPAGSVAARMVTGLRLCGVVALTLPAIAAVALVFLEEQPRTAGTEPPPTVGANTRILLEAGLGSASFVVLVCLVIVSVAWVRSRRAERSNGRASPWDMTSLDEVLDDQLEVADPVATGDREARGGPTRHAPLDGDQMSFWQLVHELALGEPAVGVFSAEGWHERYGWNQTLQARAEEALGQPWQWRPNPTRCGCERVVPAHPRAHEE